MTKMNHRIIKLFVIFVVCAVANTQEAYAQSRARQGTEQRADLDRSLEPNANDEISTLFENVVAVQRKAKVKSGKFLFNPYFSFDFSDSPYTMYGLNLNFGYALGEFWEVYFNYVPTYISNQRSIAKKVEELGPLQSGLSPEIDMERAKSSMGIEINWVPIYGKDSWGPYGIIRSDTFLNLGASNMTYTEGSGMKFKVALGKTFFISDHFNFRFLAGAAHVQMRAQGQTEGVTIGLLESGLVFYF